MVSLVQDKLQTDSVDQYKIEERSILPSESLVPVIGLTNWWKSVKMMISHCLKILRLWENRSMN